MTELLQTAQKNLTFLAVCLAITAAIFLLARLFERILPAERRALSPARRVSFVALFSALAGVLMLLELPLFFAPSFYKLDLSELPVLICKGTVIGGDVCAAEKGGVMHGFAMPEGAKAAA